MTDAGGPLGVAEPLGGPAVGTLEPLPAPSPAPSGPPEARLTPRQWVRKNLFATPVGSILSVAFGLGLAYLAYRLAWFALVSSDWEIVRRNLRRFMVGGQFPTDELWRLWAAIYVAGAFAGALAGATSAHAEQQAESAGREVTRPGRWDWLRRYWPALGVVALILSQTRTWTPTLLTLLAGVVVAVARWLGRRAPRLAVNAWVGVLVGAAAAFQLIVGPWDWLSPVPLLVTGLVVELVVFVLVVGLTVALRRASLLDAVRRWLPRLAGAAVAIGCLAAMQAVLEAVADDGVPWSNWGGLLLTVFAALAGIVLSFPLGVVVALARRSSLPALRSVTIGYIELIRGVPLVTLLFLGHYVIPLFFPNTVDPPSPLARALIAITLFEAAYVAETVRGGLQSVPRGQHEAAEALGLSPWKVTRLIVLPQALRAVIPAMVGQFISLFKDTSLLQIIGFVELLEISENVVTQPDFLGQRLHTVTFAFAALIYWAGSYTMSRESRRVERRLGLGERR